MKRVEMIDALESSTQMQENATLSSLKRREHKLELNREGSISIRYWRRNRRKWETANFKESTMKINYEKAQGDGISMVFASNAIVVYI